MKSELLLIITIGIEAGVLWWAATRLTERWFKHILIVNMLMITFFGEKMMSVFGIANNVGNIFYAAACASQIITIETSSVARALLNIPRVLFVLALAITLSNLLLMFPVVPGNEGFSAAMSHTVQLSPTIVMASFFAFISGQGVLIKGYEKCPGKMWCRYLIASAACQAVDSLIFFPLAFYNMRINLPAMIFTGWTIKTAMMMSYLPLVIYARKTQKGLTLRGSFPARGPDRDGSFVR